MIQLVQMIHPEDGRRLAVVENDQLNFISDVTSVHALGLEAVDAGLSLSALIEKKRSDKSIAYDPVYEGISSWRLLPAYDHPEEPARCFVAGTGLTHKASAANRQAMHEETGPAEITDSMKIFQMGLDGGKPESGEIGVQPEWFYKGHGNILRAHGEPLEVPAFADDGGEEPEIAGIYVIGSDGHPYRIGLAKANEFSDHIMEKKNYLYLAPSKLRTCAIGPELIVDADFDEVNGTVAILRQGETVWSQKVKTGERHMCHSLANLEYHHFKYPEHRRPGDGHVYFFGADAFSFGDGFALENGDEMSIDWTNFGRPLRNTLEIDRSLEAYINVKSL